MTLADLNLVRPELILAIGALLLLLVGAFRGKGGPVFDGLSMLVLLIAARRPSPGRTRPGLRRRPGGRQSVDLRQGGHLPRRARWRSRWAAAGCASAATTSSNSRS
jgi:hypothetical protein